MLRNLCDANSEGSEVVTIDKEYALHKSQCQGGEEGGRGAKERRAKGRRKSCVTCDKRSASAAMSGA